MRSTMQRGEEIGMTESEMKDERVGGHTVHVGDAVWGKSPNGKRNCRWRKQVRMTVCWNRSK